MSMNPEYIQPAGQLIEVQTITEPETNNSMFEVSLDTEPITDELILTPVPLHEQEPVNYLDELDSEEIRGISLTDMKDFINGMPLMHQVATINAWWREQDAYRNSGLREYAETRDSSVLHPNIVAGLEELTVAQNLLKEYVNTPAALQVYEQIEQTHRAADERAKSIPGYNNDPHLYRAAARLAVSDGVVISDMDGTVTALEQIPSFGKFDPTLLGSEIADPYMGKNREFFAHTYVAVWKPLMEMFPEVYERMAQEMPLRPGTENLIEYIQAQDKRYMFMSANMEPVVYAMRDRVTNSPEDIDVMCVRPDNVGIATTNKGDAALLTALSTEKGVTVHEDSHSGAPFLDDQPSRVVAVYWVLKGGSLEKDVREKAEQNPHIVYRTYETSQDILNDRLAMERIRQQYPQINP